MVEIPVEWFIGLLLQILSKITDIGYKSLLYYWQNYLVHQTPDPYVLIAYALSILFYKKLDKKLKSMAVAVTKGATETTIKVTTRVAHKIKSGIIYIIKLPVRAVKKVVVTIKKGAVSAFAHVKRNKVQLTAEEKELIKLLGKVKIRPLE